MPWLDSGEKRSIGVHCGTHARGRVPCRCPINQVRGGGGTGGVRVHERGAHGGLLRAPSPESSQTYMVRLLRLTGWHVWMGEMPTWVVFEHRFCSNGPWLIWPASTLSSTWRQRFVKHERRSIVIDWSDAISNDDWIKFKFYSIKIVLTSTNFN